jgi:NTP pyrophosphatase (non-canonical NTP hydrolase)
VDIRGFQQLIERIYYEKDSARGLDGTFRWFIEEVGELARAVRSGDRERLEEEFADCLAWLATMASICGVGLERAAGKYANGCPKCGKTPCEC